MDDMARDYADLIRRNQPQGPYFLIGWSLGGIYAANIAAKLERQGEKVAFLGVIDSLMATDDPPREATILDFVAEFSAIQGNHPRLSTEDQTHLSSLSAEMTERERFLYAIEWGKDQRLWTDISVELLEFVYSDYRNSMRMLKESRMGMLDAPVHVWWTRGVYEAFEGPPFDWSRFTRGRVTTSIVDSTHEEIVRDPRVHAQINELLDGANSRSGSTPRDIAHEHRTNEHI
jgi:thioesterase domain-containing protein